MRPTDRLLALCASILPLLLTGCGGGGDSGGSTAGAAVTVTPAPAPSPSPTPTPTPTPTTATPSPAASPSSAAAATSWSTVANLYVAAPDVPNCVAGSIKQAVKDDIQARLNYIRGLHGLAAVTYSTADDAQVQQSSLMQAANGQLNHTPPKTWKCWTQTGYDGSSTSNLYGGVISPYLVYSTEDDFLGGWLDEINNIVADNVGHRRWLLNPFMGKIAYGRVAQVLADGSRTDAGTLKVFDFAGGVTRPATIPDFVAYPQGDYPARYFKTNALLSFSAVPDKTTIFGNNGRVNFAAATITVTAANGTSLAVSNVSYDNEGYGVANNIQWKVAGLTANTVYTVKISGVTGGGAAASYSYTFRIVS